MVFMMDLIRRTNFYYIDKFTAMNNLILITKDIPKKIAIIIVCLVSNAVAHDVYLQGQHRGYETCRQYISFNTLQIENLIYAYLEDGDGTHDGGVGSPPRFGPSFVEISDWLVENMPYDRYDNWLGKSDGVSTLPKKMDCTRKSYAQNNGPYWMHTLGSPFSARLIHGRYWSASAKPEKYPRSSILKITKSMWTGYGLDASYATHSVEIPECVVLTIPANSLKSDTHDFNNKFTLKNEFNIHSYEFIQVDVSLLPLDLDIIHPATGEVAEGSEDSTSAYVEKGKGGLVAIRRNSDTPLTKLVLRAVPGLPTTSKFRLDVESTFSSGHIKIWKDQACTQLVTSQQTEFDVGGETTLYLEGVDHGSVGDLKIIQEIKVGKTWQQGDKVSIAVVHAEIEVVLRCFIPHKWTDSEPPLPIPVAIILVGIPPLPFVETSSTIAGDRPDYSTKDYENENDFRLSQMIVMTPYKELHSQVDIASKRDEKAAPLTEYYRKSEDIPAADQNADFGETLAVGAAPNWFFPPNPTPVATYTNAYRAGDVSKIKVTLSGGPGTAPFVPDALTPNIDWEYTISMTRMEYGSNPHIRVEVDGNHNLYPAYEVIAQESDGVFVPLYQVKPLASILPGPNSLNVTTVANGSQIDLD
jgi:hypothetical protein